MRHLRTFLLAAALAPAVPAAAAAQQSIGSFTLVRDLDAITDVDRSAIGTPALDSGDRTSVLVWRCMEDGLNVVYDWDKYFGGDDDDDVLFVWRFDKNPAWDPEYARLFTDGNTSAWIRMSTVESFTRAAVKAGRVVIRVTDPLDDETITDTFELEGLRAALGELTCARSLVAGL